MNLTKILQSLFGNKSSRDMKLIQPYVDKIKAELDKEKEEKAKTITEDDAKDGLDQIQKLTDKKIKQIDELKAVKEKDVLEV